MSKRTRRHHSPSQKAELLRKHHQDKVPISDLCNQHQLQPSVLYHWQRHLWEHAAGVFTEQKPSSGEQQLEAEVAALRAKLAKKEHVISELSAMPFGKALFPTEIIFACVHNCSS